MKSATKRVGIIAMVVVLIVGVFAGVSVFAAKGIPTTVPQKSGVDVKSNNKASVDLSNLTEGYVIISYTGGKDVRTRVQITKDTTYTYEINNKGNAEVYPLTEGNGKYTIKVYENTSGDKYAVAYETSVTLTLRDEFLPFLYPNQFVNYSSTSKVVTVAAELAQGTTTELEKLEKTYNYVVNNFSYDYAMAKTVESTYVPNLDDVMTRRAGICFDYASVMTAMLRSQNIPSKLVIGYAGNAYHAWINVYIEGQGWIDGAIYFDGEKWSLMDPTFVSSGNKSSSVMQFVTNAGNYTQKFAY